MHAKPAIAFFGSDAIAIPLLQYLASPERPWQLTGVVTQPDRRKGRGKQVSPNPLAIAADALRLPIHKPEKPNAALRTWLRETGVQLGVVMAYGHILGPKLLGTTPQGWVNFHASLLPKYRGASPIETAIACGENLTGVSFMRIEPSMDTGAVADTETVAISPTDTGASVRETLAAACPALAARVVMAAITGELTFVNQQEEQASYCRKLTKDDGALDFHASAHQLACRINGFTPWPGAHLLHKGNRIKAAGALAQASPQHGPPGQVVGIDDAGMHVATADGVLQVKQLQKPGGKWLPASVFRNGYPLSQGDQLDSAAMSDLLVAPPK